MKCSTRTTLAVREINNILVKMVHDQATRLERPRLRHNHGESLQCCSGCPPMSRLCSAWSLTGRIPPVDLYPQLRRRLGKHREFRSPNVSSHWFTLAPALTTWRMTDDNLFTYASNSLSSLRQVCFSLPVVNPRRARYRPGFVDSLATTCFTT